MNTYMHWLANVLLLGAALISCATAHMAMSSPCPRYNAHGENCPAVPAGQSIDYDQTKPIGVGGASADSVLPLCKHTTPFATPSAIWKAGTDVTVKFNEGGATHGGGHCQFSLSYDGGKTFVVVHEVLRNCFFQSMPPTADNGGTVRSYSFALPKDLPSSDKAVFAWTWVNAVGNREFYMNCADVAITDGSSNSYTGKEMTIANYPGYPTIPAFGSNYDTGLDLYTNAGKITVTGSGSSSPPPNTQSSAESPIAHSAASPSTGLSVSNAATTQNSAPTNIYKLVSLPTVAGTNVPKSPSSLQANVEKNAIATKAQQLIPMPIVESSASSSLSSSVTTTSSASSMLSISSNSQSTSYPLSSSDTLSNVNRIPSSATSILSSAVPPASVAQKEDAVVQTGSSICTVGEFRCTSNRSTFDTCDNLGWVTRPCAPGTICLISGASASPCQYASAIDGSHE